MVTSDGGLKLGYVSFLSCVQAVIEIACTIVSSQQSFFFNFYGVAVILIAPNFQSMMNYTANIVDIETAGGMVM
jgi:hypothetical protein